MFTAYGTKGPCVPNDGIEMKSLCLTHNNNMLMLYNISRYNFSPDAIAAIPPSPPDGIMTYS